MPPLSAVLRLVAAAVGVFALTRGVPALMTWLAYLRAEPFLWDAPVYWTVGRGIAHGLAPYQDLFDYKMPGIFLISALSESVSGGPGFGYRIENWVLTGIAVLPAAAIVARLRSVRRDTFGAAFPAAAFGTLLAIYLASRCGGFQTETFGSFSACVYAAVLYVGTPRNTVGWTLLLAPWILLAVGIKEPYAAVLFAVALVLTDTPRQFSAAFILPFAAATVAGVLILALNGWLSPFIRYCREIFAVVGMGAESASVWDRMSGRILFSDLWSKFSPPFAAAILVLPAAAWAASGTPRTAALRVVQSLAAIMLTSFAVRSGPTTFPHHLAMAAPLYLAFLFRFTKVAANWPNSAPVAATGVVVAALLAAACLAPPAAPMGGLAALNRSRADSQVSAQRIDGLLDVCGEERWGSLLPLSGRPLLSGFTRHSPNGPVFFLIPHFSRASQFMRDNIEGTVSRSGILVVEDLALGREYLADLAPRINEALARDFTTTPWPCAQGRPLPAAPVRVLFRRR